MSSQVHLALEADTRLLEKIGMPVQGKLSLLEEGRLEFDRRGIDIFRRENIPDIGGMEKYLAGVKGLVGTLVHIGQRAVTNSKNVDLQRVDRLKSVLPPFLPKGGFALGLLPGLLQIDVQFVAGRSENPLRAFL